MFIGTTRCLRTNRSANIIVLKSRQAVHLRYLPSFTPVKSMQLVESCLSIPSRLAFAVGAMALRHGFGQSGSLSFVKTSGQQTDSHQYTSNRKRGWRALHHTFLHCMGSCGLWREQRQRGKKAVLASFRNFTYNVCPDKYSSLQM